MTELKSSNQYIVSLQILVCTEEGQPCDLTVNVLDNHIIQGEDCDWHPQFADEGLSLKIYFKIM